MSAADIKDLMNYATWCIIALIVVYWWFIKD